MSSKLRQIIEKGANVLGTTTGATLAVLTGSPEVTIALSAISATGVYQKVGTDIADRFLSQREQERIGGVLALSIESLNEKIENNGKRLRDDGFFDVPSGDTRSDAEEALEGMLRKAQDEYEERKLPYLAHLWANACIDRGLSAARLNYMIKLTERLTYRQLAIIFIVGEMHKGRGKGQPNPYNLRPAHYEQTRLLTDHETSMVLSEIIDLHNLNCVETVAPLGPVQVNPSELKLGTWGYMLFNAMELWRIGGDDEGAVQELVRLLR